MWSRGGRFIDHGWGTLEIAPSNALHMHAEETSRFLPNGDYTVELFPGNNLLSGPKFLAGPFLIRFRTISLVGTQETHLPINSSRKILLL